MEQTRSKHQHPSKDLRELFYKRKTFYQITIYVRCHHVSSPQVPTISLSRELLFRGSIFPNAPLLPLAVEDSGQGKSLRRHTEGQTTLISSRHWEWCVLWSVPSVYVISHSLFLLHLFCSLSSIIYYWGQEGVVNGII